MPNENILTDEQLEQAQSEATQASAYNEEFERTKLAEYSKRLYRWYILNPSFFSGDIVVMGHPDYRIGNRLLYKDPYSKNMWEFYIESVEHNFSYNEGYTTTLGVTRGLKVNSEEDDGGRFAMHMGAPEQFTGGILGEASIQTMIDTEVANRESSGINTSSGGIGGAPNAVASKVTNFAISIAKLPNNDTAYHWGGGHGTNTNPLKQSKPYLLDCSSFVYWAFDYIGATLGTWPMTTWDFHKSDKLKQLGAIGSGISPNELLAGDIVFFNGDSHVGIATGDGDFVAFNGSGHNNFAMGAQKKPITTGYWANAFQGHVMRYKG